ncbi:hypothetical protein I6F48_08305 [Pseudoalteromonas sp. SWYJ118]|uniref:hypothetical protein n=1 Tax=unclassified Pseudoalteromonas TaxID=194690 RepID=UPI0018CD3AB2|nr:MULTISPECIES: hypothetical protein [unclassified Pseudoalteromonas]MBH0013357.1 hypothetical protein [Pseudoalteromonas sp. NZS100_1]MBH0075574.1 hypothetical protein [Pseudoalteromonas sp. SWYJ118]
MNVEDLVSILSQVQYKQSLDWYVYLLVVISSGLGAFFISYFKEKGKNYATKDDFKKLQESLSESTKLVESIKSEFSEKTWIKQQLFPTKQEITRLTTKVIYEFQELMQSRVQKQIAYHYIEYEHCGLSGGGYNIPYNADPKYHEEAERLENEYWESATKEIELERERYNKKYMSGEYKEKEKSLSKSILISIDAVLNLISINKAILSEGTINLSVFLNRMKTILTDNPMMGDTYKYELQEMSSDERSEYYIDESKKLLSEINDQYTNIIQLTKDELDLT